MNDSDTAEMLVLAGLTYRGFEDVASGEIHEGAVRGAVANGLATLAPVRGKWKLVWGPATRRANDLFDSSAMYVVRSEQNPERYVVAVRGTNPISLSDWLEGDLNVGATVAWPFATDGAAVSGSTALGLRSLLEMRSGPPNLAARILAGTRGTASSVLGVFVGSLQKLIPTLLHADVGRFAGDLETLLSRMVADSSLPDKVKQWLATTSKVTSQQIGPPTAPEQSGGSTLFQFLSGEAARSHIPLRVTITGHSKGGALAPTLALWLKEVQTGAAGVRGWDRAGQATLTCVTFAGPTPGNAAFAKRIESQLRDHHRIANTNDIVTHAWEVEQLRAIGKLYGKESARFERLFDVAADGIAKLDYRQAQTGVTTFAGSLDPERSFVFEVIHQHLDAYLERFGLSKSINALTFFFG
jgi:hypothetical protein